MKDRMLNNFFPISGGSIGAVSPVIMNITWSGVWELALQAAIFAIIGGVLGWSTKRGLDYVFSKKK